MKNPYYVGSLPDRLTIDRDNLVTGAQQPGGLGVSDTVDTNLSPHLTSIPTRVAFHPQRRESFVETRPAIDQ